MEKENKELQKIEINANIKDLLIQDKAEGGIEIVTDEGSIVISSFHEQDCCESVYADFSVMKYHKEQIIGKSVRNIVIKSVEGMGFLLVFEIGYHEDGKVFIGCYNYQNGYYSSDLSLSIIKHAVEIKIDISNLVENHID